MSDEQTEIQADTAPSERPDWLPSKFEKPEDLAKSYVHADAKITEQGQELAALRSQIEEIQASQTQQQSEVYQSDIEQRLYDAYESGDGRTIAMANAYLLKQATEQVRQEFEARQPQPATTPTELIVKYAEGVLTEEYPDWPEYRAKAGEIIQQDALLSNALAGNTSPSAVAATLKTAYELAKFRSGQSAQSEALEAVDALNRQVKNQAQTLTGTNSSEEGQTDWDAIKAARSGIPRFGG